MKKKNLINRIDMKTIIQQNPVEIVGRREKVILMNYVSCGRAFAIHYVDHGGILIELLSVSPLVGRFTWLLINYMPQPRRCILSRNKESLRTIAHWLTFPSCL